MEVASTRSICKSGAMVGGRHAKEARSRKRIRAARVCPCRALRRGRAACPRWPCNAAMVAQRRWPRWGRLRAEAVGRQLPHAYVNPRKSLLTCSRLQTYIHVIHSLMLISFENVNCLFNMNFLLWKNILWRWQMVTFEIRILRIRSFLEEPRKYWLFLGEG